MISSSTVFGVAVGGIAPQKARAARGEWRALSEYPDLAGDWSRLQAQADGTPFTHWHWVSTWLERLPAQVVPRVFRAEDEHGLLALALVVMCPLTHLRPKTPCPSK